MTRYATASNCDAPLQPPEPVDAPSAKLPPYLFDLLAGEFLRKDQGGKHAEAFDAWLPSQGWE